MTTEREGSEHDVMSSRSRRPEKVWGANGIGRPGFGQLSHLISRNQF
jgi:hypothetical protein